MRKILNSSSIWDLHIHSCNSPKSSGDFQKMDVKTYVDKLLEIFSDYSELSMISFTDHNVISYDVYKEFYSRKTDIELIPGIEIDVDIDDVSDSKHLIFYFNVDECKLEEFSIKINNLLKGKRSIKINELLQKLIEFKIEFLISPHAFKQNKRAINYDWNDENITENNMHKYMDQFFCFWEASGYSDIATAIEFLKRFDSEDKISIISFSDSSDEKKLRNYLSNPTQYFKSLPNFKGLQLCGTDSRRILKQSKNFDYGNSGNIIGNIKIGDKEINLSDQLNVIVGGRGSGKSLLLDNIALNLISNVRDNNVLDQERIEFLDTQFISLYNYDGSKINIDSKKIDYYDQSYVSKIFNSKNSTKEIEKYFNDEFDSLGELNKNQKLEEIKLNFNNSIKSNKIIKPNSNISDFVGKYIVINEKNNCIKFSKTKIKDLKTIDYDISDAIKYSKEKSKLIPNDLKNNIRINEALLNLIKLVNDEVIEYNKKIEECNFDNIIKRKCVNYLEEKDSVVKDKNEQEELFLKHFSYECNKYEERSNIVNAFIQLKNSYIPEISLSDMKTGVDNSIFKFEKKLIIEDPMKYFRKICEKHIGVKVNKLSIDELINLFIYDLENEIKEKKSIDGFITELKSLDLYNINYECNILYGKTKEKLEIINKMSPGTQTNILMEYIVSKDTTIPLLIDQPEDNIDNETIYTKLTNWFRKLKSKRQVIVVTHDANIVINADAENVVIATKEDNDIFNYCYGALEYGEILDRISIILDGGVEAVERRLKKYGREKNQSSNK